MDVVSRFLAEFADAARAARLAPGPVAAPWTVPEGALPEGFAPWRTGAAVAFLGDEALIPPRLLASALARGRTTLFCLSARRWTHASLTGIVRTYARGWILVHLRKRPDGDFLVRALRARQRRATPGIVGPENGSEWDDLIAAAPPPQPFDGPILHVNIGLGPGGAERQIVDTLLGLVREGARVAFLGEEIDLPGQAFHRPALEASGISVDGPLAARDAWPDLPPAIGAALARLPAPPARAIASMAAYFARMRPAVVHAWQDETGARAGMAALIAGVPRIVLSGVSVAPDWIPDLPGWTIPAWRALSRDTRVRLTNNSRAGAASYAARLGLSDDAIARVPNGVDLDALTRASAAAAAGRAELGAGPEDRLILGVLRLAPEKRPLLWIEAAALAARRAPSLRFVLVGAGPLAPACRRAIAASGLGPRLRLLAPRAEIGAVLAAADALVLTSAIEGMPNVALEALALGTPVLATDAGDLAGALTGDSGRVLPPGSDAATIAAAIVDMPRVRTIGGPAFVRAEHALETMLAATRALYAAT
jgi:Glycosyl transferases group 1/Glycosyltransferase Family 4